MATRRHLAAVAPGSGNPLDFALRDVIGRSADPLARVRGITTIGHLLDWLPRRYLDPSRPQAFADVPMGEDVVVIGTVTGARSHRMRNRRGNRLVVTLEDERGAELELAFFNRTYLHEKRLVPQVKLICSGQISAYGSRLQLTHPDYAILDDGRRRPLEVPPAEDPARRITDVEDPDFQRRLAQARQAKEEHTSGQWLLHGLIPVYTATKGLSPITHGDCLDLVFHALSDLPDPIPAEILERYDLPGLLEAYRCVHRPADRADVDRGLRRLRFQEAFVLQTHLARARLSDDAVPAVPRPAHQDGMESALREALPYTLTPGQEAVLNEIGEDLGSTRPMHRLLQGEVGSGKTVVSLLAMLRVVDAGAQAVLLAPTEVLAAQHHRSISALLGPMGRAGMLDGADRATRVVLLTGSQSTAERREALLAAASGEAGIVIGTHAVIQEHVSFAELGLVVVDEQHRFGVEQRDALRAKVDGASPHLLVMTATPIPRTVAMTVYGDMHVSTLRELPRGRQEISSYVVDGSRPGWIARTWERVAEEVAGGGQVYVVCPRIGAEDDAVTPAGSEGPGSASQEDERYGVLEVARELGEHPATGGLEIAVLHGRLPAEEKDAVMADFTAGRTGVLVSTTVIEVGVDVANATTMVILDADRFGFSQLHQLRGRVGRGGKPGLCLLVTQGEGVDPGSIERLQRVATTSDGFALARMDLEARREGDVLGARQSGAGGLRFLVLARDEEIIGQAHEAAWPLVEADPELDQHPDLATELRRLDATRAAFLERG